MNKKQIIAKNDQDNLVYINIIICRFKSKMIQVIVTFTLLLRAGTEKPWETWWWQS